MHISLRELVYFNFPAPLHCVGVSQPMKSTDVNLQIRCGHFIYYAHILVQCHNTMASVRWSLIVPTPVASRTRIRTKNLSSVT